MYYYFFCGSLYLTSFEILPKYIKNHKKIQNVAHHKNLARRTTELKKNEKRIKDKEKKLLWWLKKYIKNIKKHKNKNRKSAEQERIYQLCSVEHTF